MSFASILDSPDGEELLKLYLLHGWLHALTCRPGLTGNCLAKNGTCGKKGVSCDNAFACPYCLSFKYHMRGKNILALEVYAGDKASLAMIWVKIGSQTTDPDKWDTATIDIQQYSNPVVRLTGNCLAKNGTCGKKGVSCDNAFGEGWIDIGNCSDSRPLNINYTRSLYSILIISFIIANVAACPYCLSFKYHMKGTDITSLLVFAGDKASLAPLTSIWEKTGSQTTDPVKWDTGTIDIPQYSNLVVNVCRSTSYRCGFELNSESCVFNQAAYDDFDWTRWSEAPVVSLIISYSRKLYITKVKEGQSSYS
ncbi:unnamed protein product [Mytilus edulis]|uniref:MAM domain-containing protein n=1 Tax=Mytilus edulis TaxID=6550 RepID=A0A8S3S694_MYTED|nr:unnamed protein product [Mytilus edulis]